MVTSSELAARLSLPSAPTVDRPGGCSTILLVLSVVWVAITLSVVLYNIRVASGLPDALRSIALGNATQAAAFAVGGLIIALIIFSIRRSGEKRAAEDEQKLLQWKHMQERWNRANYCHRCDVVYIDGDSAYVSPSNMLSLLARGG